jgi:hypothetical protein
MTSPIARRVAAWWSSDPVSHSFELERLRAPRHTTWF